MRFTNYSGSLNRQHRDESDFVTDKLFDIEYNNTPLLEIENSSDKLGDFELDYINHVEFATEDNMGNWNLLLRNKKIECYDGLCKNGGRCEDGFNRYTCVCDSGYEGTNCEWDFNDCRNVACYTQDASIIPGCRDGHNTYECLCLNNWTGKLCDNPPDEGLVRSLPPDVLENYPENYVQNLTLFIPEIPVYGILNTGIMIIFNTLNIDCQTGGLEFVPVETLDGTPIIENQKTYNALNHRRFVIQKNFEGQGYQ